MEPIYLDSAATTPVKPEVIENVIRMMKENFGNPSSLHKLGIEAEKEIKKARNRVAESIKARDNQIIFTSGGTEANNLAIYGLSRLEGTLITTKIEHSSILEVFNKFQSEGREVAFLGVNSQGLIDFSEFEHWLSKEPKLVSFSFVNNEFGTIQDLAKIIEVTREKSPRTLIHTDAVQAWGKIPLSVIELPVDALTLSAHKMGGPKGIGALFIRRPELLQPIFLGGGQEAGLRSGTENTPGIVGMGKAATLLPEKEKTLQIEKIKEDFYENIKAHWSRIQRIGPHPRKGAPHILNLSFPGCPAQVLLQAFSQKGVYVSTGSACSSKNKKNGYKLQALGLEKEIIDGAIRFSFSEDITPEKSNEAVQRVIKVVKKMEKVMGSV